MKGKKLFLLLLAFCLVFGENANSILAEDIAAANGAKILEEGENTEDTKDTRATQDGEAVDTGMEEIEKTGETGETAQEDGPEPFGEEVANVTDTMLNSISYALSATITQERAAEAEQAKLAEQAKRQSYTKEDLMYLSCIIYCEAGNQSLKGKIAVANVVMNRVESDVFDHVTTIKEAIYDCKRWGRQFSPVYVRSGGKWTTKGSAYEKALSMYRSGSYAKDWQQEQMDECIKAARSALEGKKVIGNFLYFNMGITSTKAKCKKKGAAYEIIGCHIFY